MTEYQDAIIQKYSFEDSAGNYNNESGENQNEENTMRGGVAISHTLSNDPNKKVGGGLQDFYIPIGINYKASIFSEKASENAFDAKVIDGGMYDKLFNMIGTEETNNMLEYSGNSGNSRNSRNSRNTLKKR